MSGSVLTLSIYSHHRFRNEFVGMVVIDGTEIPRLTSGIDDPNAPQRKTYELPLLPDTMTPGLEDLIKRNSKYKSEQLKRSN